MERALADLEAIRGQADVQRWIVLGHSWGSDLAVRYAVEHPEAVSAVVGVAGKGHHSDRTWSAVYEAGRSSEPPVEIAWSTEVHASLGASFTEWIHRPDLSAPARRLPRADAVHRRRRGHPTFLAVAAARRARADRQLRDCPRCPARLLGHRSGGVDRDHHPGVRPREVVTTLDLQGRRPEPHPYVGACGQPCGLSSQSC